MHIFIDKMLLAQLAGAVKKTPTASLQRDKTSPYKYPWYDTKLHLIVRLKSWISGECGIPLHWHYSLVHWSRVVVLVRVPCMSQIELFYDLSICKQATDVRLNCWCDKGILETIEWVMLNKIIIIVIIVSETTWNHLIECKQRINIQ